MDLPRQDCAFSGCVSLSRAIAQDAEFVRQHVFSAPAEDAEADSRTTMVSALVREDDLVTRLTHELLRT